MNGEVDYIRGSLLQAATKQGLVNLEPLLPDAVITEQLEVDTVPAEELRQNERLGQRLPHLRTPACFNQ
jgi:hypothetical protein